VVLAKTEKQALRSELYTLNVNVNGEVVLGASEAERSDELDALEVEAFAPTPPNTGLCAAASQCIQSGESTLAHHHT
jgi:hypothetical protein